MAESVTCSVEKNTTYAVNQFTKLSFGCGVKGEAQLPGDSKKTLSCFIPSRFADSNALQSYMGGDANFQLTASIFDDETDLLDSDLPARPGFFDHLGNDSMKLVYNLSNAIKDLPAGLNVLKDMFSSKTNSNYAEDIEKTVFQMSEPEEPEDILLELCRAVNEIIKYALDAYLPYKESEFGCKHFYKSLGQLEHSIEAIIVIIIYNYVLVQKAFPIFLILANLHILYLQELAMCDFRNSSILECTWGKKIAECSKLYVSLTMLTFTQLWKTRIEGLSKVNIQEMELDRKSASDFNSQKFIKLKAEFFDAYAGKNFLVYRQEQICKLENVAALKEKIKNEVMTYQRNVYIPSVIECFNVALHHPRRACAAWLTLQHQPVKFPKSERLACLFYSVQLPSLHNQLKFFRPHDNCQENSGSEDTPTGLFANVQLYPPLTSTPMLNKISLWTGNEDPLSFMKGYACTFLRSSSLEKEHDVIMETACIPTNVLPDPILFPEGFMML